MEKVYCLYRVSTKGQVEQNDIPMQKKECHAFAEEMGWTICKEFLEKGVSGFKVSIEDRDAIQELKAAAKKREFDILLVFMFDRLGRIRNETPFVLEWFVNHGIQVWSAKEGQQKFDSDADYLLNYIRFWQANGESNKTSLRVKTRLGQLVEEGKFTGGVAVFGYKFVKSGRLSKEGKELVELAMVPEEAKVVRFIFQKMAEEGYGTWQLSNLLNSQGLRTHSGCKFHANTINRIIKNRIYTGYFVRGGKKSPYIPQLQIVEAEIFEEAQNILKARKVTNINITNIPYTTKGGAPLAGNIFCAHCGTKMYGVTYSDAYIAKDGTKKIYRCIKYLCPNRARRRGVCNGQSQYVASKIDRIIIEKVRNMLDEDTVTSKEIALAKEFENASPKRKKIIICKLFQRIIIGRGYNVEIISNHALEP